MTINNNDTIVMTYGDLKRYVKNRERLARINEIELAKPMGYNTHLKRRIATLTGCDCKTKAVLGQKKNLFAGTKLVVRELHGVASDFSDIDQYIVRK